jgi:hypothetical protein
MRLLHSSRLASKATLTVYLAVNVGAAALHHHHEVDTRPGGLALGSDTRPQLRDSPTDDDDDEHCLLCSILNLARILPTARCVDAVAALSEEAFPTIAIKRPNPLETYTHSRAPPHGERIHAPSRAPALL